MTQDSRLTMPQARRIIAEALAKLSHVENGIEQHIWDRLYITFGGHGDVMGSPGLLSEEQIGTFARQAAYSAKRMKEVSKVLREFESFLCDDVPAGFQKHEWKPFSIIFADDKHWTHTEAAAFRPVAYPKSMRGIYIHSDACTADDPVGQPCKDGYSVIRYIGKSTEDYDAPRRTKSSNGKFIKYRWTDIIPLWGKARFLIPSLEMFLLEKVRTTDNRQYQDRTLVATICDMHRE